MKVCLCHSLLFTWCCRCCQHLVSAGNGPNVFADVLGGRKLRPHIDLTAEASYCGLMIGTNRSIVICGESGRQMLKYLCTVAKSFRQCVSLLFLMFGSVCACWMRFRRCKELISPCFVCISTRLHSNIVSHFVLDAPSATMDSSHTSHSDVVHDITIC